MFLLGRFPVYMLVLMVSSPWLGFGSNLGCQIQIRRFGTIITSSSHGGKASSSWVVVLAMRQAWWWCVGSCDFEIQRYHRPQPQEDFIVSLQLRLQLHPKTWPPPSRQEKVVVALEFLSLAGLPQVHRWVGWGWSSFELDHQWRIKSWVKNHVL